VKGGAAVDVPTMQDRTTFGYAKRAGYRVVTIPYSGGELQFVVLVPNKLSGLHSLEKKLDAAALAQCAKLKSVELILHLPKFKLEPPTIPLGQPLQDLGMKTAFDIPEGTANFDRMAPRKPEDYLKVSEVFHKTFIAVDERGTEAAAATAIATVTAASIEAPKPKPIEVKVDRPFVYAIQHVPSGACLFLGRVTDPR
jgi:serpin B